MDVCHCPETIRFVDIAGNGVLGSKANKQGSSRRPLKTNPVLQLEGLIHSLSAVATAGSANALASIAARSLVN